MSNRITIDLIDEYDGSGDKAYVLKIDRKTAGFIKHALFRDTPEAIAEHLTNLINGMHQMLIDIKEPNESVSKDDRN